jgi:F0F1-type ATP synthase membrane subunit c/vacuolar-type H+-ATPase subunit K
VGIDLDLDPNCRPNINLILRPCFGPDGVVVISRSEPRDTSQNFPGLRSHDGHLDVIDTEILSMCLTGGGYTLRAGLGQGGVISRSLGAVAEQPGNPILAESFFDVFFVVETPQGSLYNQTPLRLASVIYCVPPKAAYIHPTGCLPLFTSPIPGQGMHVANLVSARHNVNIPIIPTLTEWGLIILVLLIVFITWVFLKKRQVIGVRS